MYFYFVWEFLEWVYRTKSSLVSMLPNGWIGGVCVTSSIKCYVLIEYKYHSPPKNSPPQSHRIVLSRAMTLTFQPTQGLYLTPFEIDSRKKILFSKYPPSGNAFYPSLFVLECVGSSLKMAGCLQFACWTTAIIFQYNTKQHNTTQYNSIRWSNHHFFS